MNHSELINVRAEYTPCKQKCSSCVEGLANF